MKRILLFFLLISSITYAQFEPMLWKLNGVNIEPTNSSLKVSAANVDLTSAQPLTVLRTTNFSTTSTTYVDVTGISIPITAGKKYTVNIYIAGTGGNDGVYTGTTILVIPASSYLSGFICKSNGSTVTPANILQRASATSTTLSATVNNEFIFGSGLILECGTTGTIKLQAKISNSIGTNTIIAGTYLTAQEIR